MAEFSELQRRLAEMMAEGGDGGSDCMIYMGDGLGFCNRLCSSGVVCDDHKACIDTDKGTFNDEHIRAKIYEQEEKKRKVFEDMMKMMESRPMPVPSVGIPVARRPHYTDPDFDDEFNPDGCLYSPPRGEMKGKFCGKPRDSDLPVCSVCKPKLGGRQIIKDFEEGKATPQSVREEATKRRKGDGG